MKNRVKETIILVLMYVFIIALMLGGTWGVAYLTEKLSGHEPDVMIRSITINAAIFIPLLIFTIVRKDSIKDTFGLHKIKFTTALWAILLSIVCSPMYMLANLLSQLFVPNVVAQNFDSLSSGVNNMGVLLFATVIMAPIFEELVCRGFFFNNFKKIYSVLIAAVVSALMFGIMHMNLNQFCYTLVLGIVFAFANQASGSIFTSMIAHFCINAVGVGTLWLASEALKVVGETNLEEVATENQAAGPNLTSIMIFSVLAIISFLLTKAVIRKIAKNEGNEDKIENIPSNDSNVENELV